MPRDPRALLLDMQSALELLESFRTGRTFEDYQGDALLRSAVERQFEILGEALRQLRGLSPQLAERVPDSARVIGLRNVLAHAYSEVSPEVLWDALEHRVPDLLLALRALADE